MIFRRRRQGFSRVQRLHYLLWSLLFLMTGATQQGFGLRPCIHDDAMRDMPAMAGMHGGAMSHGDHHSPSPAPEHTRCTCLGMCQAGGTATLPAPILHAEIGASAMHAVAAALPRHERLHAPTPHLIPFSHAPPRLG